MRPDPPSIGEQKAEVARQERIKILAAQADARWEAKPKVMQDTGSSSGARLPIGPAVPSVEGKSSPGEAADTGATTTQSVERPARKEAEESAETKADPWARARARGPSEDWQPEAWTPPSAKR